MLTHCRVEVTIDKRGAPRSKVHEYRSALPGVDDLPAAAASTPAPSTSGTANQQIGDETTDVNTSTPRRKRRLDTSVESLLK